LIPLCRQLVGHLAQRHQLVFRCVSKLGIDRSGGIGIEEDRVAIHEAGTDDVGTAGD